MIRRLLTTILFSLAVGVVTAAEDGAYKGGIRFQIHQPEIKDSKVHISVDVILDSLQLHEQSLIALVPNLELATGSNLYPFDPIVIGRKRALVLYERGEFASMMRGKTPAQVVQRRNGTAQRFTVHLSAPYLSWMRMARVAMYEHWSGCAGCDLGAMNHSVPVPLVGKAYEPVYQLAYVLPELESVKERSERFVARFNFEVGRSVLLQYYKNNGHEFARVDSVVRDIVGNKDITVSDIRIDGYASPEGNQRANLTLSRNRAQAFVGYLVRRYGLQSDLFHVTGHGADWAGLEKAVQATDADWKADVLNLLAEYKPGAGLERKLTALRGGKVYREMLDALYPPLRRTEYMFTYIVRPFSVEEAREVIKTKPWMLSLNEMYLVAQSYPVGSPERVNVLAVAARVYPNNPVSKLNLLSTRLQDGNTDAEIEEGLFSIDLPEATNNLGVLYMKRGDKAKALECFQKAGQLKEAAHNIEESKKEAVD